jgi:hypothetical protein
VYQVTISINLEVQHKISSGDIINRYVILYCVNLCVILCVLVNAMVLFLHVITKLQSSALCTLSFKYFSWYANQMFDDDFIQEQFGWANMESHFILKAGSTWMDIQTCSISLS